MEKMKKTGILTKLISFALTFIFVFAPLTAVVADSTEANNFKLACNVLIDLKIIESGDISSGSDNITRQELALFLARIRTATPEYFVDDASAPPLFKDLTEESSKYMTAISYCGENGIMEGNEDGTFNPTGTVTLKEAIKIFVTSLGYTGLSYPNGYISKATEKDVKLVGAYAEFTFEGVSVDKTLTKNDVIMLLYNFFLSNYFYLDMVWDADTARYISAPTNQPVYEKFMKYNLNVASDTNDYLAKFITASVTSSGVVINGKGVSLDSYNINGNNYFKLRDLAYVLNGTDKKFEISWDAENNAISLTSGKSYTAVGGEMAAKADITDKSAINPIPTKSKIYLDGKEIAITAYNINGNNYFKLADIGQAFDFSVTFNSATNTITIDTNAGYKAQ